jgi:hypothetical protein
VVESTPTEGSRLRAPFKSLDSEIPVQPHFRHPPEFQRLKKRVAARFFKPLSTEDSVSPGFVQIAR